MPPGSDAKANGKTTKASGPTEKPGKRGTPGSGAKASGAKAAAAAAAGRLSASGKPGSRSNSPRDRSPRDTPAVDVSDYLDEVSGVDPFAPSYKVGFDPRPPPSASPRGPAPTDMSTPPASPMLAAGATAAVAATTTGSSAAASLPEAPPPLSARGMAPTPRGGATAAPPLVGDSPISSRLDGTLALEEGLASAGGKDEAKVFGESIFGGLAFGGEAAIADVPPAGGFLEPTVGNGRAGGGGVLDVLEAMNPFATRSKVGDDTTSGDVPEVIVDYQQLVWSDEGRQLPPGVNAAKLEAHLSDGQFEQVLGMGRVEFYAMTKVEQMRCKQEVGLF